MSQPDLFSPFQLGELALPNRVVLAPMTRNRAGAGNAPGALNALYYAQRAGAGLLVTEATQVAPEGVGYPNTPGANVMVVVDNVASGHQWPSGAAQDRRLWFEVIAYKNGAPIYQSGIVPDGSAPTEVMVANDPDFWLIRDCMFDAAGKETHAFWDAATTESKSAASRCAAMSSRTSRPSVPLCTRNVGSERGPCSATRRSARRNSRTSSPMRPLTTYAYAPACSAQKRLR